MKRRRLFILTLSLLLSAIGAQAQDVKASFTAQEAIDVYYQYGFDGNLEDDGWELQTTEKGKEWYTASGASFGYDPTDPGALISHNGNKTAVSNEWIISPEITVKEGSKASFYVKFAAANIDLWNTFFRVIEGTDSTSLFDFRSWAADEKNGHVESQWEKVVVDLSAYTGKTVKLAFQYVTESVENTGSYAYIDAVQVGQHQLDGVKAKIALDDEVHFMNTSTGDNLSYAWTFANGTPATSTEKEPVVKYTTLGDHDVTLVVTNTATNKTDTKTLEGFVHVGYRQPVAAIIPPTNFNYVFNQVNPFLGPGTHKLQFKDNSDNHPTAWKWEITDTNGEVVSSSTEQNPALELTVAKDLTTTTQYSYSLVASNEAGSDSVGVSQGIKAGGEQAIWASRVKPASTTIYAYTDEIDGKTGYIGGTNDWGITKWAVRYEAPTDIATIDYLRVCIPTAINKESLTLTINEEDERGLPGRELLNYAFTQSKKASTMTKTSNFNSITLNKNDYVPITKPFFLTLSMPKNGTLALGGVPQEKAEDNTVYAYVDSLQQWKEWDGEPFALLLTPTLSYIPARVEQAMANFKPSATITAVDAAGEVAVVNQNEAVTFKATVTNGEQFTYAWEFPGGEPATSTQATPQVVYPTAGEYDVRLTVTNEFGVSATAEAAKYVEVAPVTFKADFSAAEAQSVYFTDDFEEKLDKWEQDSTYTGRAWQTLFNTDTGYELIEPKSKSRLYVYNTGDKVSNAVILTAEPIDILPKSKMSFYAIPELVNYESDVIAVADGDTTKLFSISDWQKTLTDYDQSWQLVTVDLSAVAGKSVRLGFTFSGERKEYERVSIDDVKVYQTGFNNNLANVYIDDQVHYVNQSVGENLTYAWTFEGGQPATSTEQNPVVAYNAAGTYKTKLVITGSDSKTETVEKEGFVTVGYKQPVPTVVLPENIFYTRTGCTPYLPGTGKEVTFAATATNHPEYFTWEILDEKDKVVASSNDSKITFALDTLTARYSTAFYHYRLTVGNPGGEAVIESSTQAIKVGSSTSIWNVMPGEKPTSVQTHFMMQGETKLGNYGGSNNAGVTKWAERFTAPLDTAYIMHTSILFSKCKTYTRGTKASLYIAYEDENGLPGEPIVGSEITLNASQLVQGTAITRTASWNNKFAYDDEYPLLILPRPFYVVVEGFGTYEDGSNDMAIASMERTDSEKTTTWMLQDGQWKPADAPVTLLISPWVGYDPTQLRKAIDDWVKTSIRDINVTGSGHEEYYDLNGRRLQQAPQQGIYILRTADGKVTKQIAR